MTMYLFFLRALFLWVVFSAGDYSCRLLFLQVIISIGSSSFGWLFLCKTKKFKNYKLDQLCANANIGRFYVSSQLSKFYFIFFVFTNLFFSL
ncbi:hypothetical protein C2G38_2095347 [Gigaspora rosea]|uniref:Uncharacterized protein n=1 Tax=Gigaspora rosea TaxID=44941 RepID=A0A397UWW6_9GLOM|nr:hypothetical protein C2G38_2095347 [Gigaspora rosea]